MLSLPRFFLHEFNSYHLLHSRKQNRIQMNLVEELIKARKYQKEQLMRDANTCFHQILTSYPNSSLII